MATMLPQQFAKVLYGLTVDKEGKDLENAINVFATYLIKKRVVKKLPYIVKEFEKLVSIKEDTDPIHVISARELSQETLNHIKKVFGEKRSVTTSIDTSIIGGTKIAARNTILDGSIKTQLETLKQSLM